MARTTSDNGSVLLVPMHIDALVINRQITAAGLYNRWRFDYSQMNQYESPMLPPFDDQKTAPPSMGVYLHWALPDGLTHGVENEKGSIEFPLVPNRWLVVRLQEAKPTAAWVVLSDELGASCASPFIDPQQSAPGQIVPTRLGGVRTLDQWDAAMGEAGVPALVEPFLKAVAPGNVTFAAFAPGVENVFAFHDDLQKMEAARLTYLVLGWYSHPESMDPLFSLSADAWKNQFLFNASLQFQAELDSGLLSEDLKKIFVDNGFPLPEDAEVANLPATGEWRITAGEQTYAARLENGEVYFYDITVTVADNLNWAVRLDGAPLPQRTLVHGMIYGVDWNPKAELKRPPDCPDSRTVYQQVRVSVGNTAIEALSALISSQAENAEVEHIQTELLDAFQYDLLSTLDESGGRTLLDQNIRQAWFGSELGGTLWRIVARERDDSQAGQPLPVVTPEHEKWLADLNYQQRELDAQRRLLASQQWELYALWWKSKRISFAPQPKSKDRQAALSNAKKQLPFHLRSSNPNGLLSRVSALQKKVAGMEAVLPLAGGPQSAESIARYALAHHLPDELELKPTAMPRFWYPTDPVIVISGLGRSEKYNLEGTLFCRRLSQAIGEITVIYKQKQVRLAAGELKAALPHLSSQNVPACTEQLLAEAFFLDTNNAAAIAQEYLGSSDASDAVSQAIDAALLQVPTGMKAIGRYGALAWKQPWVPLFLDWQVRFYSTYQQMPDGSYQFDRGSWKYKDSDYSWTGGPLNTLKPGALSYSGRIFLTSQAAAPFADRLKGYVDSHKVDDPTAAENLVERIKKWDILSQTMSGFTSQLAMRDIKPNILPDHTVAPFVENQCESLPFVNIVPDVDVKPGAEPPFFFPLRAGFFSFENLRIIDSFGRVLDLMHANGNAGGTEQGFFPIRGRNLTPDGGGDRRLVKLAPRVVQSSRLSFRYVSAQDDRQESGLAAGANPVCGWLLPNHLNHSIAVYATDGSLLGDLLLIEKSGGQKSASWQPAPGSRTGQISNPHLKSMITALISRDDPGAALADLLNVIDKTLWTSDPLGERGDLNLSVLIGRPLALVRSNLKLELSGRPYYNQSWHETFQDGSPDLKENQGGLLDLAFCVRLGNSELRSNGLVGYFQGVDYDQFHAVQLPEDFAPADKQFIQQIRTDENGLKLKFQPATGAAFDPTGSVYVTMLVDPRGVVQAESGLLPTKTVELPQTYFAEPLKRMAVKFRVGPLLLDAQIKLIPQPAEHLGKWNWIQARSTAPGNWEASPVGKANASAQLTGGPYVICEGWLEFVPDKIDE
jgi:hypothetical protein